MSASDSWWTVLQICSSGLETPLEDSLCVSITALKSGSARSASRRTSMSAASPRGNSSLVTSAPTASTISLNRMPKNPMMMASTLSPGEMVLKTAVSMAPVPDDVMK